MKQYKVIVTPDAEEDLRKYVAYLRDVKKNPQAVKNVLEDFRDTKKSLKNVAGSIKEPDSEKLKEPQLSVQADSCGFSVQTYISLQK